MKPNDFEIVLKYNKEQQRCEIVLNPTTGEVAMGLESVKDILEFLQRVIIKRFC